MATAAAPVQAPEPVHIPAIQTREFVVTVTGESILVTKAKTSEVIKKLEASQQKKAKGARVAKDPEKEFHGAMYIADNGKPGIKAACFREATGSACKFVEGMEKKKTWLFGTFSVLGDILPIDGKVKMRTDMVRNANGVADIRYRPEFWPWSVKLTIRYDPTLVSVEQLVNLLNRAGFSVGVGEWRPEKGGEWGRFKVQEKTT